MAKDGDKMNMRPIPNKKPEANDPLPWLIVSRLTKSLRQIDSTYMNPAVKNVLESCSPEERTEVAAYLVVLDRIQNSQFQQEMVRRSSELQAGINRLSSDAVSELDSNLSSNGL